jgi:hypothetical protein
MLVEFDITKEIGGKFYLEKNRVIGDSEHYRPGMVYTRLGDKDYMSGYLVVTENRTRYLFGGRIEDLDYFFYENLKANIIKIARGSTRYSLYLLYYKFNRQDYVNNRPTELRVVWSFSKYEETGRGKLKEEIDELMKTATRIVEDEKHSS